VKASVHNGDVAGSAKAAGQRPVLFFPQFARVSGSVEAGLLLSQLAYWHDRMGRSFYKADAELAAETGLSERSVRTARGRLRAVKGLKIERRGWPAKVFYEIDEAVFLAQFSSLTEIVKQGAQSDRNRQTELTEIVEQTDENRQTIKEQTLPYTTTDITYSQRERRAEVRSGKRFKPPTVEEVRDWLAEHPRYAIDAQAFIDYYEAMDWRGSNGKPVRSWRAKIVTWSNYNGNSRTGSTGPEYRGQAGGGGRYRDRPARDQDPGRAAEHDPDCVFVD